MKINQEKIERIAHLARLELSQEEKNSMVKDFESILTWMEQLNELDTSNVEPLIHMHQNVNVMRKDVAVNTISREEGLINAPQQDGIYFKVPKVIE
jgi:aspartyl-tRNA(Asn)/glutamyl-tRNA(Gln) amidotransferase subunit C